MGILIMMDMPNDMKGLLKSITLSRSDVMVIGAMAISASWNIYKKLKTDI